MSIVVTHFEYAGEPVPPPVTYEVFYPVEDLHDLEEPELQEWARAVQTVACSQEQAAGRTLTFDVIGHVGMWRLDGEAQGAFRVEVRQVK